MSDCWIGIDGGGTRATAVAVDAAGDVLARQSGGPALLRAERPTALVDSLAALIRATAGQAGVRLPVRAVCCALAGAGRTPERAALRAALLAAGLAADVLVVADAEAALHDAFAGTPGMLLIAGTGSVAWARGGDGALVRVGGWGERLGDEGSGYDIGITALRAVARAADGRAASTALSRVVLAHARVGAPAELIAWAATAAKADIAALAPLVIDVAERDAAARAIVDGAIDALVDHVAALLRRLGAPEAPLPLALAGGLIAPGAPLHGRLEHALHRAWPSLRLVPRRIDAASGAAQLARLALT